MYVALDAVNEGLETFLVRITGVLTACPFVIGNGNAIVEILDREGKLIAHYTNTAITNFFCNSDFTAMLEFVSPLIQVAEEEGMEAEVCTRLVLCNNKIGLTHNITTTIHILMSGPVEKGKVVCTR